MAEDAWLAGVRRLVAGRTDAGEELALLDILAQASPAHLEELSGQGKLLDDLVASIEDHNGEQGDLLHLGRLLDWAGKRLPALTPAARAAWLHALPEAGEAGRAVIAELLLAATGDDLWQLLAAVDAIGDHRDLEWLVFSCLDADRRDAVLAHLAQQAPTRPSAVRVVSDIDDTLFASLNDPVYPSGVLYPGALAFLTRCGKGAPVTFVTARPQGQAGFLENHLRRQLAAQGVPAATVLSGRLSWLAGHGAMASGKATNIGHLVALHPGDRFVLVGDSGQADVAMARQVLERWPGRVAGVFIHKVTPSLTTLRHRAAGGIIFFDSYAGAAAQAVAAGLLSRDDFDAIVQQARIDLAAISFITPAQAQTAQAALDEAVAAAKADRPT